MRVNSLEKEGEIKEILSKTTQRFLLWKLIDFRIMKSIY